MFLYNFFDSYPKFLSSAKFLGSLAEKIIKFPVIWANSPNNYISSYCYYVA